MTIPLIMTEKELKEVDSVRFRSNVNVLRLSDDYDKDDLDETQIKVDEFFYASGLRMRNSAYISRDTTGTTNIRNYIVTITMMSETHASYTVNAIINDCTLTHKFGFCGTYMRLISGEGMYNILDSIIKNYKGLEKDELPDWVKLAKCILAAHKAKVRYKNYFLTVNLTEISLNAFDDKSIDYDVELDSGRLIYKDNTNEKEHEFYNVIYRSGEMNTGNIGIMTIPLSLSQAEKMDDIIKDYNDTFVNEDNDEHLGINKVIDGLSELMVENNSLISNDFRREFISSSCSIVHAEPFYLSNRCIIGFNDNDLND